MPGVPDPVGVGPSGLPPFWTAVFAAIKGQQQATNGLASGAPSGWVTDQWGNVTELSGANLNQVVTIGAAYQQPGVLVSTGIANGTAGRAVQSGPAITTITLTKNSTSATVGTVTGAILAQGQVIGAALVNDPATGTPTSAITPGTTIASPPSGSSVTLSQPAAESGANLYCAACLFIVQHDTGWEPLSLASGVVPGVPGYPPSYRIRGDAIELSGAMKNNTGGTITAGTTWATAPANAVFVQFPVTGTIGITTLGITAGALSLSINAGNGAVVQLDNIGYRLG